MTDAILKKLNEVATGIQSIVAARDLQHNISTCIEWIITALHDGNKLMICGNGGSAADAQHVAGEFLCRFYTDRRPLPAIALTTDTSTITAIGNDYNFDQIFSRQVEALGKPGDILLGISTSGSSKNILTAFKTAGKQGIKCVLLTGSTPRDCASVSNLVLAMPSIDTPRVQEMMLIVEHVICEFIEKAMVEK